MNRVNRLPNGSSSIQNMTTTTWIFPIVCVVGFVRVVHYLGTGVCTLDEQGHNLPLWGTDSYTSTSTLFW